MHHLVRDALNSALQKLGFPWLTRNVRTKIPERFRYWTFEDTAKRRAVRDQLVTEIKKKLKSKRRVDCRATK